MNIHDKISKENGEPPMHLPFGAPGIPRLYVQEACPMCVKVKMHLGHNNIAFRLRHLVNDKVKLVAECEALGFDFNGLRSAPVMVTGSMLFEGEDCLHAIAEGSVV